MRTMTSLEKQKIAQFLDLTSDFLGSGYKSEKKEYQFEDDAVLTAREESIGQIEQEVKVCRRCRLWETRTNAAPGEGVLQPLVMVIGEGPGVDEDRQGRPFVGKAGQLLDKMLSSIGLSRNANAFIANVVKCRPPFNRDPQPEETSACAAFLERQITLLKPKFILAAGRVASQTLLQTSDSIGKLHGKFKELKIGNEIYPLICTYHPAALLRDDDLRRPTWEDLKLLKSKLDGTSSAVSGGISSEATRGTSSEATRGEN